MNEILISIIMPAYNVSQFIDEAIDSILQQTHKNFELLICDDASTDDTLDKINQYNDSRIKLHINKKNIGYLKTCNFLASKANGEYITFQDADDASHCKRIELLLAVIKKDNADLVGSSRICNFGSNVEKITNYPTDHRAIVRSFSSIGSRSFFPNSVMFSQAVYKKIGLYRDCFNRIGAEDYDWILRASESFTLVNILQACYFYRDNPHSVSRTWQLDVNNVANMSPFIAYKMYLARVEGENEIAEYDKYTKKYLKYPISHLVVVRRLLTTGQYRQFIKLYIKMLGIYKLRVFFYIDFWLIFRDILRRVV
ncbi:glycosyltransferase family 2 protein [Psychromonas sp. L1A2]|uniref:glycosyltransferase family 2 protein n=1 Tax=Psychromonas sp. L1A2 TaxID=2686356 RepID=UPI0013596D92|nr:glycosyltransferase family 2 protein [Psychromonas sp. L1A2]